MSKRLNQQREKEWYQYRVYNCVHGSSRHETLPQSPEEIENNYPFWTLGGLIKYIPLCLWKIKKTNPQ